MATKFIGVKEFRQNISKIAKKSIKTGDRLIILNRNVPILEIRPLSGKEQTVESLAEAIKKGLADVEAGRVYTHEQVKKKLGL